MTVDSVSQRNRSLKNISILKYPLDIDHHGMVITVMKYDYRGNQSASFVDNLFNSSSGRPAASIALPLPMDLSDTTSVDLSPMQLGIGGKLAAGAAASFNSDQMNVKANQFGKMIAGMITNPTDSFGPSDLALLAMRTGLTQFTPEIGTGISIGTGTLVNPHTALAFNGVSLKTFNFAWQLSPKSMEESDAIKKIVNALRHASLPEYDGIARPTGSSGQDQAYNSTVNEIFNGAEDVFTQALLRYPSMVKIEFFGLDRDHYPQINLAMIGQVEVNYSPNGHMVLQRGDVGSRPGAIQLQLSVTETKIRTKNDYAGV